MSDHVVVLDGMLVFRRHTSRKPAHIVRAGSSISICGRGVEYAEVMSCNGELYLNRVCQDCVWTGINVGLDIIVRKGEDLDA